MTPQVQRALTPTDMNVLHLSVCAGKNCFNLIVPDFSIFREFCALYSDESAVISGDNKCKIPIGVTAVNRLNRLNHKFFQEDAMPNFPDHDHRTGSLINPEGYMFLKFHDQLAEEDLRYVK